MRLNSKGGDSQEMSVIETVESVYGEPSISINESAEAYENGSTPSSVPQKMKGGGGGGDLTVSAGSPLWFNSTAVTASPSNAVQKLKGESAASPSPLWFNDNEIVEVERIETTPAECDFASYAAHHQSKDYILEHNGIDPNVDATDLLFLSYAKTLKGLSKKRQISVRMKISEIIGQAELDEEDEKPTESNYVDSSGSNELVLAKKRKV
jgi:hypothetical protein